MTRTWFSSVRPYLTFREQKLAVWVTSEPSHRRDPIAAVPDAASPLNVATHFTYCGVIGGRPADSR
jgi:hypothetical protein